jgi:uncharacterized membrane protein
MWLFFALSSACIAAFRRTAEKQLLSKHNSLTMGWTIQLFSLPILTAVMLLHADLLNPLHLGLHFWLPLAFVVLVFYPANNYLCMNAIKHSELSKVLPIQSLWPVLALIPAWLTLHEVPSGLGAIGVLLTALGVYVLGMKGLTLHHPFTPFREEKSSRYMLGAVFLLSLVVIVDKLGVEASNATYFSFTTTLGAAGVLYMMARIRKLNGKLGLRKAFSTFGILGTFQGASYVTYLLALSAGPVAYVTAVRGSNILLGSILGIIYLKESLTRTKMASFILIAIGGTLLAFN